MLATASATALLAQADESSSAIFWLIVVFVVVLAGFVAVVWVRRRLSPDEDFKGEGFTLSDLRRLHKEGQISDDEFERARSKMVEAMHAAQARQDAAKAEAAKRGSL